MKRNIAIIIPGGIGTGSNNIGVPVLERIVKLLADDFNVTVFQLFPVNKDYRVDNFQLIETYSRNPVLKCIKLIVTFWKVHRRNRFHAVHGFWAFPNGFLAVLAGKIFKIKSIVSLLGGDAIALPEIRYGQLRNPFYRALIFWALNHADEVNALTSYLVKNLKKEGFHRDDIKIIPWGIDTTLFAFIDKPLTLPIQFLHIANLHPVKDQVTLLKSFKIISNSVSSHLTIIGEGVSSEKIKTLATSLGLLDKVTFLGLLPYNQLPPFYQRAHILLHTSLSEGQSEVVTEAMSCGVVVCGTSVGLLHDLADRCIAVPVKDFEMLARSVLELVNDVDRFQLFKFQAQAWTLQHDIHWTVMKIKALYQ